ncbi:MAG: T9SS type A sorting domain-containing protein, partial [candidate division Zixibacteria bacterium]|nr:T9SS type A sorting domain-containing protein [candidate division Zixibacteria bacterium]
MKRTLTLAVLVAFLLVPALALAAQDPGEIDRIYFGSSEYDPATGKLVVPIIIENDEPITAIDIPLKFGTAGDGIVLDRVEFLEDSRIGGFDFQFKKIDNQAKTVLIGLVSSAYDLKADMAPGDDAIAYLHFTVTDAQMSKVILEADNSRAPQHTMMLIENRVVDNGREVIDFAPEFDTKSGIIALNAAGTATLPKEYSLKGNYPNPFNAKTIISFALPQESKVTLDIYNILGQKVKTLVDGAMP